MEYVPYYNLSKKPCIVVDGRPHPSAVITLSHWPKSGTPEALKDDLSTQIVFHYLDRPEFHVDASIVSNDHFDEDGLASLFGVIHPEEALKRRKLLCDFAAAGDFGTFEDRRAARAAFAISALADPQTSPLAPEVFEDSYERRSAFLYRELLPQVVMLLEEPQRYEHLWAAEDELLSATERWLADGTMDLEEVPEADLAIVRLPRSAPEVRVHRYAQVRKLHYHPMGIYNATACKRILYVRGRDYQVEYRYESWVQYVSKRPLPRVDLAPLAQELTRREDAGVSWSFEGVSELNPKLGLEIGEESRLGEGEFLRMLLDYLATAPAAWNPYSEGTIQ